MRREERNIASPAAIAGILQQCKVCRLGLYDGEEVYIVPMNFGYTFQDGRLILYFHCAQTGRKLDCIRKNNRVCFEMDCQHALVLAQEACGCTYRYASIIGNGAAVLVTEQAEKEKALQAIMLHQTGRRENRFSEKILQKTAVLRITADTFTCKQNQ